MSAAEYHDLLLLLFYDPFSTQSGLLPSEPSSASLPGLVKLLPNNARRDDASPAFPVAACHASTHTAQAHLPDWSE
jgi:hypothetical protein